MDLRRKNPILCGKWTKTPVITKPEIETVLIGISEKLNELTEILKQEQ